MDPHFASQTAILQGFAQFQGPDIVLREESLPMGLGFIAAELGLECPPLTLIPDPATIFLAEIYDQTLEDAARDAYARDYLGYGFGPWRQRREA